MLDKQKQAEAREKLQNDTLPEALKHKHVLLEWATGTSKTLMALKIARGRGAKKILLLTKEIAHKLTWEDECKKWGMEDIWNNMTVMCYASLHKIADGYFDLIINDECHGLSENRENNLEKVGFDWMVSLSATPGEEVEDRLMNICPYWKSEISMDKAISLGILPEPTIYIVDVEFDDVKVVKTVKGTKGKKARKYTSRGYYDYLSEQIKKFKSMYERDYEDWQLSQLVQTGARRKKFMAQCKTEKAKEILEKIKHKRFICFTGFIEQCDELGGENVIHSGISINKRKQLIERLNNGEIDNLLAVNMLKESMNISYIEAGMLIQADAKTDRGMIQVLGRTLRGDDPEFYIFRLKDTSDEYNVKTALSSFNKKYIKVYDER